MIIRNFLKYYFPPSSPKTWFIFYFRLNSPSTLISHRSGARAEKNKKHRKKSRRPDQWWWSEAERGASSGLAPVEVRRCNRQELSLVTHLSTYQPNLLPTNLPIHRPTYFIFIVSSLASLGKGNCKRQKPTSFSPPTPRAKKKVSVSVKKE